VNCPYAAVAACYSLIIGKSQVGSQRIPTRADCRALDYSLSCAVSQNSLNFLVLNERRLKIRIIHVIWPP